MARVTVEDCIQVVNNRYELVLLAAQRARDIAAGSGLTVDRDNDKNPVVALREIADQTINLDELRRHIATGVNRHGDLNVEDYTLQEIAEQGPVLDDVFAGLGDIQDITFEDGVEEEKKEKKVEGSDEVEAEADVTEEVFDEEITTE